jgi:NitT/TauT family transport system substrate-binding protein
MYKLIILVITLFLFSGCDTQESQKEIKIATNKWIGYAPLFLANERGELEKLHFHLIQNVSLAEAMEVFSIGRADIVTTTQHEYFSLKRTNDLKPVILLDRSYGGDMILSNKTIEELQQADKIEVYLEIDSINAELFKDFAKKFSIPQKRVIFHNKDQQQIQDIANTSDKAIIIVSYSPYDIPLEEKGFHVIASTRNLDTLVVIDALCAREDIIQHYPKRLDALKRIIDEAIESIQENPKKAHEEIRTYLGDITYEEFKSSLTMIKWINHPSEKIMQVIQEMGYEEDAILK